MEGGSFDLSYVLLSKSVACSLGGTPPSKGPAAGGGLPGLSWLWGEGRSLRFGSAGPGLHSTPLVQALTCLIL